MPVIRTGREPYSTTLHRDLIEKLKDLSLKLGKGQNELIEEALKELFRNYGRSMEDPKV